MKATLTYHSIDDRGSPISVSPAAFAAHLNWLTSGRVQVLSLDDLVGHPLDVSDAVAISFDDGFSNARRPIEELLRCGLPVTIFVVSGHVGGTNSWNGRATDRIPTSPLLGWTDLERLKSLGATIASHTRTHASLTGISRDALDEELSGSLHDLQTRLGSVSAHIAYPYGNADAFVAERAAKYFSRGHTTDFRVLTPRDEQLRLPRLDAYHFSAPGSLEGWGTGRFSRRLAWIRARRGLRARLTRSRY